MTPTRLIAACALVVAGVSAGVGACGAQQPGAPQVVSSDPTLVELASELLPDLVRRSGLELREPVRLERRSREQLIRYLEGKLEEELPPSEARAVVDVYALLGLVRPDTDLRSLLLGLYTEQVAGFYEPDSTALFVLDDQPDVALQGLLVHELVHAIQDQNADLEALTDRELGNDRTTAAQAAIEGHATLVMLEYMTEQMAGVPIDLADVPDFAATKAPSAAAKPDGIGLDALSGTDPFIMMADGRGWLFVPAGLVDGPLPTHYEPAESPVDNLLYKQQLNPAHKAWAKGKPYNVLAEMGDPKFPYVITTYRLTEHYLAGAMSRWLPWLSELQPELFIEIGTDLAREKGIANLDWVVVTSPRGEIRAKALVTNRIGVMTVAGKRIHHVGMPWHWGWAGLSTGAVVNDLTSWVGDPNVSIHEGKAFVCNVEKA